MSRMTTGVLHKHTQYTIIMCTKTSKPFQCLRDVCSQTGMHDAVTSNGRTALPTYVENDPKKTKSSPKYLAAEPSSLKTVTTPGLST